MCTSLNYHLSEFQFLQQFTTEIFWNFAEQRTTPCSSPCNRLNPGYFGFLQNNENVYDIGLITLHTPVPAMIFFCVCRKTRTCMSLVLLPPRPADPVTVSNRDILEFLRNNRNLNYLSRNGPPQLRAPCI